jgi:hypothetical protein
MASACKARVSSLWSVRPSMQFTTELETDSAIPVLDVLVMREEMTVVTKVYRKHIHTGRDLNFNSNNPRHVKMVRGVLMAEK